jgi:flagellar FliJ protein
MEQSMYDHYQFGNGETGSSDVVGRVTARGGPDLRSRRRSRELLNYVKKEFNLNAARQRITQIEAIIADASRMARSLDTEIEAEQARTGIRDPSHFAYSTSAKAMLLRRDNLKRTLLALEQQLATAKLFLVEPNEAA